MNLLFRSIILISVLLSQASLAQELSPPLFQKNKMPGVIELQITPRGQEFFKTELRTVLGNLALGLDEIYTNKPTEIVSPKIINPEDYRDSNPDAVKAYFQVKDLLTKYLIGFSLEPHLPLLKIGPAGLKTQFKKFGIIVDEKTLKELGKTDGAVLAIEMEISEARFETTSITAEDRNNQFLGQVGINDVVIKAGTNKQPIRLRVPFYIRVKNQGVLEFEALKLNFDLKDTEIDVRYKNLLIPKVGVIINGKTFYLNNTEVENYLQSQLPDLLLKAKDYLDEFIEEQLPSFLNNLVRTQVQGQLEQIMELEPPNKQPGESDFKWGVLLKSIRQNQSLMISLDGFAEDLQNPRSKPNPQAAARGTPQLQIEPIQNYDIALGVNRSLINRIIQLAYGRDKFSEIKTCSGNQLNLEAAPILDSTKVLKSKNNLETFAKLKLVVRTKPDSVFLKNEIILGFDLTIKLRPTKAPGEGLEMIMESIDLNSVSMDDKYFSLLGRLFKKKVRQGVNESLVEATKPCPGEAESKIEAELPLPPKINGIKLTTHRLHMDDSGHLLMFLNYDLKKK